MAMATFDPKTLGSNPRVRQFVSKQEFVDATPEDRLDYLNQFLALSPEDQDQTLNELTSAFPAMRSMQRGSPEGTPRVPSEGPLSPEATPGRGVYDTLTRYVPGMSSVAYDPEVLTHLNQGLKEATPVAGKFLANMALDAAGTAGGAALGGPIGASIGGIVAHRAGQAMGLREGDPLGPPNTGDLLAGGPPLIPPLIRGARNFFTRPAQLAIQGADELNAANQTKYRQDIAGQERNYQTGKGRIDEVTQAKNEGLVTGYNKELAAHTETAIRLRKAFLDDLRGIETATDLSNAQKLAKYQDRVQRYQTEVQNHNQAYQNVPAEGAQGISIGDWGQKYAASAQAARGAKPLDPTPFNQTAEELGVQFRQPAEGLQNPFRRITDALEKWGAGEPATSQPGAILDSQGRSVSTTIPGTPNEVTLSQAIETQKALGQAIGRMADRRGTEFGAAKRLYAVLNDMLDQAGQTDPRAAKAVALQREASRDFMRNETLNDWMDFFARNSRVHGKNTELNTSGIQTQFRNWLANDRFVHTALTPEEIAQMQRAVDALPSRRVPTQPPSQPPTPEAPDYSKATARSLEPPPEPPTPITPDYSSLTSNVIYPPEPVSPSLGAFPMGKTIMGKVIGSMAGGVIGERTGVGTYPGIVGGAVAGAGVTAVPYLVSALLLEGPRGQAIVRNILSGKRLIGPAEESALLSAAQAFNRGLHPEANREPTK